MVTREPPLSSLLVVAEVALVAYALSYAMAATRYGVVVLDPRMFVAFAGILALLGLAASYIPARRATRVDPVIALRSE